MSTSATLLLSAFDPSSAAIAGALKQAILNSASPSACTEVSTAPEDITVATVEALPPKLAEESGRLLCPLTLDLPSRFPYARQELYQQCRDVVGRREQAKALGYGTGSGDFWLPVVWTSKGPLYGEAIARSPEGTYYQPYHLSDSQRQPLYRLGQQLLRQLGAPPSVYLLQVGWSDRLVFDRLWPFPGAPALASLEVQSPDLFTCYWRCLTQQPIRDLQVKSHSKPMSAD